MPCLALRPTAPSPGHLALPAYPLTPQPLCAYFHQLRNKRTAAGLFGRSRTCSPMAVLLPRLRRILHCTSTLTLRWTLPYLHGTLAALEREGCGHDAHGEDAHLACDLGNDGRSTAARAAAHASLVDGGQPAMPQGVTVTSRSSPHSTVQGSTSLRLYERFGVVQVFQSHVPGSSPPLTVTKTMSVLWRASAMASVLSWAAFCTGQEQAMGVFRCASCDTSSFSWRPMQVMGALTAPISGLPPAPRPRVSLLPICTLCPPSTGEVARACSLAQCEYSSQAHRWGPSGMGRECRGAKW